MEKKYTLTTYKIGISILFFFYFSIGNAQVLINYQGFDGTANDTWNYTSTLNTGTIQTNTTTYVSSPNALRLGGSSSASPDDPFITFNNVSLNFHTDVYLNIYFSSNGTPDDRE